MTNSTVFVGIWFNWSKDAFFGATLTVPSNYGNVIIAFLALFVSWTGSSLWAMMCYIVHQSRSTLEQRDGLHHQQQVTLRSGVSSPNALWAFLKIYWSWKSQTQKPLLRSIALILLALVYLLTVIAAGLLSSRLTTTDNEVLLRSSTCGWLSEQAYKNFNQLGAADLGAADALFVNMNWDFRRSADYVRSCYDSSDGRQSTPCDGFVIPRITSTIERNSTCPFELRVCRAPAIRLDSGMIESNRDLGINTKSNSAVKYRKVTSCVPLVGDGVFDSPWTKQSPARMGNNTEVPGEDFRYYYFGPSISYGRPVGNETFFYKKTWSALQNEEYIMWGVTSFLGNYSVSDFVPISALNRTDADVTILALANKAVYSRQFKDPWFQPTTSPYAPSGTTLGWLSTTNMSFVGCTEQYQVCTSNHCSPLSGLYTLRTSKVSLSLSPPQCATFDLAWKALWSSNLEFQRYFFGSDVLLAKENLYNIGFRSVALDDHQWELEMANMHNISLAMFQSRVVKFASPQDLFIRTNVTSSQYIVPASGPDERHLCQNIKIRSARHTSFRFFGLLMVLLAGTAVTILNLSLVSLDTRFQRFRKKHNYRHTDWVQANVLQLQRKLFEARGVRPWRGKREGVPVTEEFAHVFSGSLEDVEIAANNGFSVRSEAHSKSDSQPRHSI